MTRVRLAAVFGLIASFSLSGAAGCARQPCETVACGDDLICKGDICTTELGDDRPAGDGANDGSMGAADGSGANSGNSSGTSPGGSGSGSNGSDTGATGSDSDTTGDTTAGNNTGSQPGTDTGSDSDTDGQGSTDGDESEPVTAGGCPISSISAERCSFEDEDCDGANNEGLDCTFVASSRTALWKVEPFLGEVTRIADVDLPGIDEIFDIDTDVDGTILAIGGRTLYRIDLDGTATAMLPGALPFNANGLAVGVTGSIYISNHDNLASAKVVVSDSSTTAPVFFSSLDEWDSSGDCVSHKAELFITAVGDGSDVLVVMNLLTGEVEAVGPLGIANVMGLSSAYGFLFGLTKEGAILSIDDNTGTATVLHQTNVAFSGGANRR